MMSVRRVVGRQRRAQRGGAPRVTSHERRATKKVRVGVAGATGLTGAELLRWLLGHPYVEVTAVASSGGERAGMPLGDLVPALAGRCPLVCEAPDPKRLAARCDVVCLALPHTVSMELVPGLLAGGARVIDLSADYRLKEARLFERWYGARHADPAHLTDAVYGLPEFHRAAIRTARLVANPGCYPTSVLLGLAPLIRQRLVASGEPIIVDAKSGVTGAGRKVSAEYLFSAVNENLRPYKVEAHQHTPEVEQEIAAWAREGAGPVVFVPHLVPMNRGLLSTIYVRLRRPMEAGALVQLFRRFYAEEPFVRVKAIGQVPQTGDTLATNYCDLGIAVRTRPPLAIVLSAIDNLGKGAATQAVHNLNIMCGFAETAGLAA